MTLGALQLDDSKLHELLKLQLPKPEKAVRTLFDVSGFPRWETVTSNWYAYFLSTEEDHTFNDLFVQALVEVIQQKDHDLFWPSRLAFSQTEVTTNKGNSIDIVVKDSKEPLSSSQAIVIELKIDAGVYNDLTDYLDSIEAPNKVGVLLTLQPQTTPPSDERFLNITHAEWHAAILRRLGNSLLRADSRSIFLLQEFLNNLNNMSSPSTNPEALQILIDYGPQIHKLAELKLEVEQEIASAIIQSAATKGWESPSRQGQSLALQQGDMPFKIYIWLTELFATNEIKINCWIKGAIWTKAWNKWDNDSDWDEFAARYNRLPYRNVKAGKEWFQMTDQITYSNIVSKQQDISQIADKVADILETEWRPALTALFELLKKHTA